MFIDCLRINRNRKEREKTFPAFLTSTYCEGVPFACITQLGHSVICRQYNIVSHALRFLHFSDLIHIDYARHFLFCKQPMQMKPQLFNFIELKIINRTSIHQSRSFRFVEVFACVNRQKKIKMKRIGK